jgi:hypothetical protein
MENTSFVHVRRWSGAHSEAADSRSEATDIRSELP